MYSASILSKPLVETPRIIPSSGVSFNNLSSELPFHDSELKLSNDSRVFKELISTRSACKNLISIYNNWITESLPFQVMSKAIGMTDEYGTIHFQNMRIIKPSVLPHVCRDISDSYMAEIVVDIVDELGDVRPNFTLGRFPAMLGSVVCNLHGMSDGQLIEAHEDPNDPFTYFIIKGTERIVITQEHLRSSMFITYVEDTKGGVTETRYTAPSKHNTYVIIMRKSLKTEKLKVHIQHMANDKHLNVFWLFRVLGFNHRKAILMILRYCPENLHQEIMDLLAISVKKDEKFLDTSRVKNPDLTLYQTKRTSSAKEITEDSMMADIRGSLFPNAETDENKAEMLAMMASRTCLFTFGYNKGDDRDSWSNKQLQTAGSALEVDMNSTMSMLVDNVSKATIDNRSVEFIAKTIDKKFLEKKLIDTFNANAGPKGKGMKSTDSASTEPLRRETLLSVYSSIMKINTPTDRKAKKIHIRGVHGSQIGSICVVETPAGTNCGLVKSKTVSNHTSNHRNVASARKAIKALSSWSAKYSSGKIPVLVNGVLMGWAARNAVDRINRLKLQGKLPFDCTCLYNGAWNVIEYYCNGMRPMYPVYVVEDNELVMDRDNLENASVDELFAHGAIMYVDAREMDQGYNILAEFSDDVRTAKTSPSVDTPQYTHCLIEGITILGVNASLTPLSNMSQGPRAVYQASMFNQALGFFHYLHTYRYDSTYKRLEGPSRSFTETLTAESIGLNTMPSSETPIIAIICTGTNYEDAITMNKQYLDRQNMRYSTYTTYKTIFHTKRGTIDYIVKPAPRYPGESMTKYHALDEKGYPVIGSRLEKGDCILGILRVTGGILTIEEDGTYTVPEGVTVENVSLYVGVGEDGYVHQLRLTMNVHKEFMIKVKLGRFKMINVGDKFAAAQIAQKGTCGDKRDQSTMIRVATGPNKGISPDIEFNSHSLPSRMTINMMLCMLLSKYSALFGERIDATTFHQNLDQVKHVIKRLMEYAMKFGMNEEEAETWAHGEEVMENASGIPLMSTVYMCPCTEQLLRHLVDTKIQVRGTGPIQKSNRQPVHGRAHNGGLRTGEMERDAVVSFGASKTLLNRMRDLADLFPMAGCITCGHFANVNPVAMTITCLECGPDAKFCKIKLPYSLVTTVATLGGLHIDTKFDFQPMAVA